MTYKNAVPKLMCREIGVPLRIARLARYETKFHNIQLQEEFDAYENSDNWFFTLQFLKRRSQVIEILAAKGIIFVLTKRGLGAAFSRATNKRICLLNVEEDEVINSLFYNKNNESLITLSLHASDSSDSWRCRTVPIEFIKRNQLNARYELFGTESSDTIEFDVVNNKALIYSTRNRLYKVFDMDDCNFKYSISQGNIKEIKISPGILLLKHHRSNWAGYVPLKILSVEDGTLLKSFKQQSHRSKQISFMEQFGEKLIVKQEDENLQIVDVRTLELIEVTNTEFFDPSAFIFLHQKNLFMAFQGTTVEVWNFSGELVTSFEDHTLQHANADANNIYVTDDQEIIISYCKVGDGHNDEEEDSLGSINMSSIATGKCVAKICPLDPALQIAGRDRDDPNRSTIRSTPQIALRNVTAVFYDEERNEIYTGNVQGFIHVWSN